MARGARPPARADTWPCLKIYMLHATCTCTCTRLGRLSHLNTEMTGRKCLGAAKGARALVAALGARRASTCRPLRSPRRRRRERHRLRPLLRRYRQPPGCADGPPKQRRWRADPCEPDDCNRVDSRSRRWTWSCRRAGAQPRVPHHLHAIGHAVLRFVAPSMQGWQMVRQKLQAPPRPPKAGSTGRAASVAIRWPDTRRQPAPAHAHSNPPRFHPSIVCTGVAFRPSSTF